MAKRKFSKPTLSVSDVIAFMQNKGMAVDDQLYAERCLAYLGYYRLKIYTRPFEDASKRFRDGTTFEQIVDVYNFDRDLRLLCLGAIERIEVALRAQIVNVMGAHGGPHFCYDNAFFERKDAVARMRQLGKRGKHLSITHYKAEYSEPPLPAIWCFMEASTFGEISKLYADLKLCYRKEIAKGFGFDETICVSWFKTITTLRNICAHHGRLWNAELHVNGPKKAKSCASDLTDNTRCYSRFIVLAAFLKEIDLDGGHSWVRCLVALIEKRPVSVGLHAMGFPNDWKARDMWK